MKHIKLFESFISEASAIEMKSPENLDLTKPIGKTYDKELPVYPKADHPAHKNFDYKDWEEAADIMGSFIYDKFIGPNIRPVKGRQTPIFPSKDQEKKIKGLAEMREEQAKMNAKSQELYDVSPDKTRDDERRVKSDAAMKNAKSDQSKALRDALKKLSPEDKNKVEKLKKAIDDLKWNHAQDAVEFGVSVGERRKELRNAINKIVKKYLETK